MSKVGRPTDYKPEHCETARKLCAAGATDKEIALELGVTERTINRWKADYPEFCQSLKAGKAETDERVVRSLYQRAIGYDWGDKHIPPDTTAQIFWLKNRLPAEWRDKQQTEISGPNGGPIAVHDAREITRALFELIREAEETDDRAEDV